MLTHEVNAYRKLLPANVKHHFRCITSDAPSLKCLLHLKFSVSIFFTTLFFKHMRTARAHYLPSLIIDLTRALLGYPLSSVYTPCKRPCKRIALIHYLIHSIYLFYNYIIFHVWNILSILITIEILLLIFTIYSF